MRVLSFIVIVAALASLGYGQFADTDDGGWGFRPASDRVSFDTREAVVQNVVPRSPAARAGIRRGDRVRALVPRAATFLYPAPGDRLAFQVGSDKHARVVTLTALRRASSPKIGASLHPMVEVLLLALELLLLALAALITWRRWGAPGAQPLVLYFLTQVVIIGLSTPPVVFRIMNPLQAAISFAGYAGLIYFTFTYPPATATQTRRRVGVWLAAISVGIGVIFALNQVAAGFLNATLTTPAEYRYARLIFAAVIPAAGLISALRAAGDIERRRIAALLTFFVAGESGAVAYNLAIALGMTAGFEVARPLLATLAIVGIGFAYMIFRHRMFDVTFALNRAAIYAALSSLVLLLFLVAEWLLEHAVAALNRTENAFLELGIALLVILIVRAVHSKVERFVDTVFFRKRHESEAAIRAFAHDVTFVESRSVIANRTVRVVARNTGAAWAALYELQGAAYECGAESGAWAPPPRLMADDPAVVAMRARGSVHDLSNALWDGAFLVPFVARGRINGFLACGPKTSGESYAPDERDALQNLALGVAIALGGARLAELESENARLRGNLVVSLQSG